MKTFITRAVSALLALAIFISVVIFFDVQGLRMLCLIAVILGTRELIPILFRKEDSLVIKSVFYILMVCLFGLTVRFFYLSAVIFSVISLIFFMVSLAYQRKFDSLESLSSFQAKSILGFFYTGLLPSFACSLLDLPDGKYWFFALLGIVFAGDTFAYLTGRVWGKHMLMPAISPKKTVEGAIGGLLGSIAAGILCSLYFSKIPSSHWILIGLSIGLVGQVGDLFESMLKRVAQVKDSGSLMPGHGGVLDRIDGVLFASPFLLFIAHVYVD